MPTRRARRLRAQRRLRGRAAGGSTRSCRAPPRRTTRRDGALPAGAARGSSSSRAATSSRSRISPARSSAFEGDEDAGARAGGDARPPRGLERVPADDRPGARARRLLPGLPRDRRARRRSPAVASTIDAGGVVRVPQRAVGRSRAAADVPPARDRPDRRARGRGRVARLVARARGRAARGVGPRRVLRRRERPVLRPQRPDARARSQREQALKFEVDSCTIAGPEPTAVASFNYHQDHFAKKYGIELEPTAAWRTPPASASGSSGSRIALLKTHGFDPGTGPPRCARSCGRDDHATTGMVSLFGLDPADLPAASRAHGVDADIHRDQLLHGHPHRAAPRARRRAAGGDRRRLVRTGLRGRPVDLLQAAPGATSRSCSASTSTRCSHTGRCRSRSPSRSARGGR